MVLIVWILAATAALVVGLRLSLRRIALPAKRTGLLLLGIAGGVAGVVLAVSAFDRLAERFERRDWPTVDGVIASSIITGERSFAPRITYEFTLNGRRYSGISDRNVPLFGNKRRNMEVAEKEIAGFPPGTPVTVYYDPGDPNRSTIMPEPRWNDYAQSGLGILLFGVGLFLTLLPKKSVDVDRQRERAVIG